MTKNRVRAAAISMAIGMFISPSQASTQDSAEETFGQCTYFEKFFGRTSGNLCGDLPSLTEAQFDSAKIGVATAQLVKGEISAEQFQETIRQGVSQPIYDQISLYQYPCAAFRYCVIGQHDLIIALDRLTKFQNDERAKAKTAEEEVREKECADPEKIVASLKEIGDIPKPTACYAKDVTHVPCPAGKRNEYCRYVKSNDNEVKRAFLAVRCKRYADDNGWAFVDYKSIKGHPGCLVRKQELCPQ